MAGELIAFSDIFAHCVTLAEEFRHFFQPEDPIPTLYIHCLFYVISQVSRTSENRSIIYIAATREGFKDHLVSDIGFVRSYSNIAEGPMKSISQAALENILRPRTHLVRDEQCIVRN